MLLTDQSMIKYPLFKRFKNIGLNNTMLKSRIFEGKLLSLSFSSASVLKYTFISIIWKGSVKVKATKFCLCTMPCGAGKSRNEE
jgi:hypothetical protein